MNNNNKNNKNKDKDKDKDKNYYYYNYYPEQMPPYLANLTYNIQYFYQNHRSSRSDTEYIFWDDISYLLADPNKSSILKKWKYGHSFFLTEKEHENNAVLFGSNVTWEHSFILGLLMYEYH